MAPNQGKARMDASAAVDHAALAEQMPLDQFDVSDPGLYQQDVWPHYFRRLRREAPVHYCKESSVGPFWSVTKYRDIVDTEVKHRALSSAEGITLRDRPPGLRTSDVHRDGPAQARRRAQGGRPIVSPGNLANFEALIRGRVREMLDGLPRGETFDWVDRVSIELTVQMLATLFDFPFEDRRKLSHWSDCSTAIPYPGGLIESEEQRERGFPRMFGYFANLWNERVNAAPRPDLISMLAHREATRNMSPREYLGNLSC